LRLDLGKQLSTLHDTAEIDGDAAQAPGTLTLTVA
jgi:hypothetical protein